MTNDQWRKFAYEEKKYAIDFASSLQGATVASIDELTATNGVVVDRTSVSGTEVRFWLSGGNVQGFAFVTCKAIASDSEKLEAKVPIMVTL